MPAAYGALPYLPGYADPASFTMAHELVELGLQVGCPALVERSYHDPGAGRAKERFCEAGAAEILMPLAEVRQELQARGEGIASLLELSTRFGTSLHAMLRRMVEASPGPCAGLILYACGCTTPMPMPPRRAMGIGGMPGSTRHGCGRSLPPARACRL